MCAGSGIAFPQPRKSAGKPPELAKRLEELKARLEQQQYDAMVADVTQVGYFTWPAAKAAGTAPKQFARQPALLPTNPAGWSVPDHHRGSLPCPMLLPPAD